jgi:hypothetical protein
MKDNIDDINKRLNNIEKKFTISNTFVPSLQSEKFATWENAMKICKKYNASLVSIESEDKNQMIVNKYFKPCPTEPTDAYYSSWVWTSGKRDSNGKFKWMSNGNDISYTNWYPNEKDYVDNYDCISLGKYCFGGGNEELNNGKWITRPCSQDDQGWGVLCEF